MKVAGLSPLTIPRAWTIAEAAALLDLHEKTIQRLIRDGALRGFIRTSYTRPQGTPLAFIRRRLSVSSRELERYLAEQTQQHAAALSRRRRAAARG